MSNPSSQFSLDFDTGLVSVIIPTHNRQSMLMEALESVRQQSYRPIEIIVVDDASTDNTQHSVAAFSAQHKTPGFSCQYFYQDNRNASLCRNFGLKQSKGQFIQFLDSDDILHPEKFTKQVEQLQQLDLDFVWSSTIKFENKVNWCGEIYTGHAKSDVNKLNMIIDFINKSQWRTESGLFTRNACAQTGEWPNISMFQDWEYHIRLLAWHPDIAYVPGSFSAARQHQQGRIGDGWQNGSGLLGAFSALKNVTSATISTNMETADWYQAILARGLEIRQQALKTGYDAIAIEAETFVNSFVRSNIYAT